MKCIRRQGILFVILFFVLSGFKVGDQIELGLPYHGREAADFRAQADNVVAILAKGTIGKIEKKVVLKSGNFGYFIHVASGRHKGKRVWVYDWRNRDDDMRLCADTKCERSADGVPAAARAVKTKQPETQAHGSKQGLLAQEAVSGQDGKKTEAAASATCTDCSKGETKSGAAIRAVGDQALNEFSAQDNEDIYRDYLRFYEKFRKKIKLTDAKSIERAKKLLVTSLLETFGSEKAGRIIMALTAYGEDHSSPQTMAAVMKVIDNRARNLDVVPHWREQPYLDHEPRDLGEKRIVAAFANDQFSVWDPVIGGMVNPHAIRLLDPFNKDNKYEVTKKDLQSAFATVELFDKDEITFAGGLERDNAVSFHAPKDKDPGYRPRSFAGLKRLARPRVCIDGKWTSLTGARDHRFYSMR